MMKQCCKNICYDFSYSDVQGLVANANPNGSPFAASNSNNNSASSCNGNNSTVMESDSISNHGNSSGAAANTEGCGNNPFILPLATGGALHLKFNMNPARPPTDPALMGQYLAHIGASLIGCGYSGILTLQRF
jgi:RNA-binding protein Nova